MQYKPKKKRSKLWKAFMLAATFIIGTALYNVLPYYLKSFDTSRDYSPTILQQEFIEEIAKNYTYVALGDTNHRIPEHSMFAYDDDMLKAITDGGKRYYFLEVPRIYQYKLNAFDGKTIDIREQAREFTIPSSWNPSYSSQQAIAKAFRHGAFKYADKMDYIASDTRKEITLGIRPDEDDENNLNFLFDDQRTSKFIAGCTSAGGVIFYGAGHYSLEINDSSDSYKRKMPYCLTQNGETFATIWICLDPDQKRLTEHKIKKHFKFIPPDAVLYVNETDECPSKIEVINLEFSKYVRIAEEKAFEHLRQKLQFTYNKQGSNHTSSPYMTKKPL